MVKRIINNLAIHFLLNNIIFLLQQLIEYFKFKIMRSTLANFVLKFRLALILTSILILLSPLPCSSDDGAQQQQLSELLQMDINELMDLKVTLPSRHEERQFDSAAAIYVITQEDIRRSGVTKISELFRMVPGLHVGQIDNNTLAISSRSNLTYLFNSMLVLLDGRTLYNPLFGGVYWDVQDTLLPDIERIEIIRGPGGSLWGANAVDGIINIITKSASKTDHTMLYGGYGTGKQKYEAAIRIGGQFKKSSFGRIYVKRTKSDHGVYLDVGQSSNDGFFPVGTEAHDDGEQDQAGFRIDTELDTNSTLTFQGDIYNAEYNNTRVSQPRENTVDATGGNIILTWNQQSDLSSIKLKFFYDYTKRLDLVFEDQRDIYDLDFQHSRIFERQTLTWGLGYRHIADDTMKTDTGFFSLNPSSLSDDLYSAFIQDQIEISKEILFLTIGSKFEHNDFTGYEYQPTLRLLWKKSAHTVFWGSLTKAVSTPTRSELHGELIFCDPSIPGCVQPIGDPEADSEYVIASELGYRSQLTVNTLVDLAIFNNNYNNTDDIDGKTNTHGLEILSKHIFSKDWKIEASYTYHQGERRVNGTEENNNAIPKNTFNFRSFWNINTHWEFDALLFYASHIDAPVAAPGLKDIRRLDLRVGWNPNKSLRSSLSVTNVLDYIQGEALELTRVNTGTGRGIFFSLEYSFD
jgi:iron complex outermembrane receptor protein